MNSTTNFIIINSKYRTADSRSTSDFTYSLGASLEVDSITIKNISIPHVQYNIESYNNTLVVNDGVTSNTLTIPIGQYDINQLMNEISSQLTTLYGTAVLLTLDPISKKIVITTTQSFRISRVEASSPLSKYIGIPYGTSYYPLLATAGFTLPEIAQLQGPNNYLLASNVLSQGLGSILTDGKSVPIIMPIPIDVEYGQIQQYESNDYELNTKRYSRLQNIQNIDIRIYDDDLNIVDLHGQDIEIVIKVRNIETTAYAENKRNR